jgi:GAF domain-containing protein
LTELRESLEQQQAIAEVLQVINSSPGDLAPVFDTILVKAHSLCSSGGGALVLSDGECFRAVAVHGLTEQFAEFAGRPFRANPITQRLQQGERLVHIPDVAAMASQWDHRVVDAHLQGGARTILAVPLRKDEALLGYISAARPEVRRRPLVYPRAADRTRRGSQSVHPTPPRTGRPHVQSRLNRSACYTGQPTPHQLDGILSRFQFSATDKTP